MSTRRDDGTDRDHLVGGRGLMVSVRSVLVGLALAFTAYLAARGLLRGREPLESTRS